MSKKVELLSKGLFEKSFMDSKVKTRAVSKKEWILGHLIGPLGLIFVVNTIAALVEKFFTQQTGAMYGTENLAMIQKMGGYYEVIMTVAKLLAVVMGLVNGWLMQHTKSRQGRDTIVSITSRSAKEKAHLKFIRQMSWTLISGIVIGMLVNMVVLPMWLEHDLNGYATLLTILSIVAIPLLLLEYFYTKERVIEDVQEQGNTNNIPVKEQLKALLTNKYFVIFTILMTVGGIVDNFKGGNVQYFYIKYLLGGENNWAMFTIYQVVTGVPLGIGAFVIYPLAKKFGIKNVSLVGYGLVLIGSIVGWLQPSNMIVAFVAGFIRQMGYLPNLYVTATLLCYAYDSVEQKSGLRLEGLLGVAIITAVQTAIYAPFAGGYEAAILKLGFVDVAGVTPSAEVTSFMATAFYLFDIILATAYIVLLPFMDVEKKLPEINAELLERKKAATLARGEEWIDPAELESREAEENARIHEENRIADLKEHCAKKGLDFDVENAKYLAKQAKKQKVKK